VRPVIVVGHGARFAMDAVQELADQLEEALATALAPPGPALVHVVSDPDLT